MNERIEKLAREAGYEIDVFGIVGHWDMPELRKFAELIIRDVTETAAKYRQSKTRPVGWNFTATVLDHYGLKEE